MKLIKIAKSTYYHVVTFVFGVFLGQKPRVHFVSCMYFDFFDKIEKFVSLGLLRIYFAKFCICIKINNKTISYLLTIIYLYFEDFLGVKTSCCDCVVYDFYKKFQKLKKGCLL